jgi:5-methylcytosine-specific restriction protein A
MNTYLLTWKAERWHWEDLAEAAATIEEGEEYCTDWSTGNRKNIEEGDRVFLYKQGKEPRGILAAGVSTSSVYEGSHWGEARPELGLKIDVSFERILNPELHSLLSVTDQFKEVNWGSQSSGILIPAEVATIIEKLWQEHLDHLDVAAPPKRRSPAWQRDELILALDLYVRYGGKYLEPSHPDILELSRVLNELPIHPGLKNATFRNPNGVALKLMNFRRFDPNQPSTGMRRGNRLEEVVWNQFAGQPELLRQIAEAIRTGRALVAGEDVEEVDEDSFPEGRVLFRVHRLRERNRKLVAAVKAAEKKRSNRLACCVCGFDFSLVYGKLGEDFIEAHHTKAVSGMNEETQTKLSDMALVCSNCHRMIHRRRPWLQIEELQLVLIDK